MFKKWGAWVSCFSQGVRRSDPFWQGAWVRAQLWNATAAIFPLENRWFPDFCSWKLAKIGHAQRPASQPASQGNEIQLKILNKFNSKSLFLMKILNILLHFNLQKTQNLLKKMQNDQNYPTVGSPSISKSHVGPGIQQKPRIWTLISLIIYDFCTNLRKSRCAQGAQVMTNLIAPSMQELRYNFLMGWSGASDHSDTYMWRGTWYV